MKRLFAFFVFILILSGSVSAQIARGSSAWVAVRTITLKSSTWFFASSRGTLAYGDEVSVLQVNGKWAEVRSSRNSSVSGWVDSANLRSRRIVVSSSTGGASASEIALAGKGFSQEVENAYRSGGNLNYADVDKTEALIVPQDELLRFMQEGRLFAGGQ